MSYSELVYWHYRSVTRLFSSKNTKEQITVVSLTNPDGRAILDSGEVACLTLGYSGQDPYFSVRHIDGYTARARRYGKIADTYREKYPKQEDVLSPIKTVLKPYGNYVFININYLDNYVNSISKDPEFYNEHFIYRGSFNKRLITKLLKYKPQAMFGGEIASYSREEIPKLLTSLRFQFPELYQDLLRDNQQVKDFDKTYSNVGKTAKLKTMNAGKVSVRVSFLDTQEFDWNGEILTNKLSLYDGSTAEQTLVPTENTLATILEDKTVNETTEIINQ